MKRISSFLLLLAAMVLTATVRAQVLNGDLNHNGGLDVEDITLLINGYLTGEEEWIGDQDQHEAVDLGLSVKWATMNVGATYPEEYGDYFAWGETTPKSTYNWLTYTWCKGSKTTLTKYCTSSDLGTVDDKIVLDPEDDAAHVNWGGTWRMPTRAEQDELWSKCTWTWTTQNGVNGRLVTGPNGNSIFLPAAGYLGDSSLRNAGSIGYYWSSSLYTSSSYSAWSVRCYSDDSLWGVSSYRYDGQSVRAVCP